VIMGRWSRSERKVNNIASRAGAAHAERCGGGLLRRRRRGSGEAFGVRGLVTALDFYRWGGPRDWASRVRTSRVRAHVVPLGLISRARVEAPCRWRRLGLSETRSRMSPESCRG
jgi:hypothetical protein